ncbi:response regulator transcription factor [Magnetovibrio sp. PR-2]|uniref:response regulator transcription factor n=1 Tax=Magnetovibrio sp. PR-2 TaxID=3120356 RepID=UPI002FCE0697
MSTVERETSPMFHEDTTVYIVDDDQAVRDSLSWLISSIGLNVETFETAQHFLDNYNQQRPGCVLVDVRMPGMSGLELQKHISQENQCLPVIIVTGHGDVKMAVNAMKQGAFDFIEKPYNDQVMLDLLQTALAECERRRSAKMEHQEVQDLYDNLTAREREVMEMIVAGNTNKQIAYGLSISEKTVEAHRAKVMDKLQARSLADLIRKSVVLSASPSEPG